ncbi:MAG: TIGR02265 family protein [Calditrichaeota bacterium]|nr:MAG: TIGR02265 family protein [Calditrichota bacterium]
MNGIRGLVFHSRFEYIKKQFDSEQLKQLSQLLSPQAHQFIFDQVFPVNQYPFELLKELDSYIVQLAPESEEEVFNRIGSDFADMIMDRYFVNYVEAKEPQRFLAQFQVLYPQLWNLGTLSYHPLSETSAELSFVIEDEIHPPFQRFLERFLTRAVELCGAREIQLQLQSKSNSTGRFTYRIQWKSSS